MPKKKSVEQWIEELALSVGKGFEATATKDDVRLLHADLAAVEKRLERIEFANAGMVNRLDAVEDRVLQLARKVGLEFR